MRKIFFLIILTGIMSVSVVWAQGGLDTAGKISGLSETEVSKTGSLPSAVGLVLGQVSLYLGIIFFLLLVYSGFLWMTAGGNDSQVEKAKKIIFAAVAGLIISVSAYAITNFVFGNILSSVPTVVENKCIADETYGYASCQDINSDCVYNNIKGDYEKNLCPGGANIQCCRVKAQKTN
ncbi:MAG TPA: hypothetical protein P5230_02580 [Candidatus Magasanikbacteria bacterium]|nr:hypothetical protein [Candidatus Magasanikbacteria bacterium]